PAPTPANEAGPCRSRRVSTWARRWARSRAHRHSRAHPFRSPRDRSTLGGRENARAIAAPAGPALARPPPAHGLPIVLGAQGGADRLAGHVGVRVGLVGSEQVGQFLPLQPGTAGVGEYPQDVVEQVPASYRVYAVADDGAAA